MIWECPFQECKREGFRRIVGKIANAASDPGEKIVIGYTSLGPPSLRTHGLMPHAEEMEETWIQKHHTSERDWGHMPLIGCKALASWDDWLLFLKHL